MATNGMKRLQDKHIRKKTDIEQLNAMLDELVGEKLPDAQAEKPAKTKTKSKARAKKTPAHTPELILTPQKELEKQYFDKIWEKLTEIHANPENYRFAAVNLARIYAMNKSLEDQMQADGGHILSAKNGNLYTHPAVKIIQANNAQILLHLKALGMTEQGKTNRKTPDDKEFTSEFAQFQ